PVPVKNVIIFILAASTIVAGYMVAVAKFRLPIEGLEGKTEKIIRGDLTLPINATGEIRPNRRVEIKSEASGEVVEIAKHAGDQVRVGDLLIRLQPDDEQRIVNRARLDLEVAKARLEDARIILRQAETADLRTAQAQVDQLQESVRFAKFRWDKVIALPEHQRNEEELLQHETTYLSQAAQLENAKANLEKARLTIPRAQQTVKQAEATLETIEYNLADAEKRLAKTDILSPLDGVVANVKTQIGEVIQGGKTTLMGGTVLAVVLDVGRLIVRAEVDESDIGRVLAIAPEWATPGHDGSVLMPADLTQAGAHVDHPTTITVESFRDEEFAGVIERIYPEPEVLTGVVTYPVEVVITSANRDRLLPGMRADVRFTSEHAADVVLCPNEAIREGSSGELGVYVPKAGSSSQERETEFIACKFGLDNGNYSEVREGLSEGMTVYTKLPVKQDKD
ncbi:MAG: hypothetical protein KJ749_11315, partial [Planctomycetes bacterium]|nr:hypothetical protein [Planctomycetota bacterium]